MRFALVGPFTFALFVFGLWETLSRIGDVDISVLPPPSMVLNIAWRLIRDPNFLTDLNITALEITVAFAIASPIAVGTGFLLEERMQLARSLNPYIYLGLAIPQSIFLPIFILAFGTGFLEKVIFGITHAYFVIAITTFAAARSVPTALVLAARVFGSTQSQLYLHIYIPAMFPLVLTGLRLGLIYCIIGVLLTEMYASRQGLGHLIFGWGEAYQVPQLLAGILLVSILTILVNESMRFVEIRVAQRYGGLRRITD
jgi:ABC-type nitrate/sulfonate/bicarbonate transport system permease component